MKSSRRAGPRSPPLSEFWLSATGWGGLGARARPPESPRARSGGRVRGFTAGLAGAPVLSDAFASVSVLATTVGSGSAVAPGLGVRDASPCSPAFDRLNGNAAARASVPCILRSAGRLLGSGGAFLAPLTVDLVAPLLWTRGFRFFGMPLSSTRSVRPRQAGRSQSVRQ